MFVRRKLINGRFRNYAVFNYREDGKVRQRQIYLGTASTIAERILDLEEDLGTAQFMNAYYEKKIARQYAPRPYLIAARSGSDRRLATIKTALERLNAIGQEHGLLPTIEEREERAAAKQKRDEETKLFFARCFPSQRVVPTPFISQ